MKRYLTALVALLCVGLCLSASAGVCVVKTSTGLYAVTQGADGKPQYEPVVVIDLTGGPPVAEPPGGGDGPPAGDLKSRTTAAAAEWAAAANHPASAQGLSVLYRTLADKVRKGDLPTENAFDAAREGADLILKATKGEAAYAGFRKNLTDYATAEVQANRLTAKADYADFFDGLADALDTNAAEAPALDPVLMQLILTIILTLLRRFIPGLDVPGGTSVGL